MDNKNRSGEILATKPVLVARDFLTTAILLVVIVFLWIGFGVYKILTKVEVPEPAAGLARPVKVGFPQEVWSNLRQRQNFRDRDLDENERVILREGGQLKVETSQ